MVKKCLTLLPHYRFSEVSEGLELEVERVSHLSRAERMGKATLEVRRAFALLQSHTTLDYGHSLINAGLCDIHFGDLHANRLETCSSAEMLDYNLLAKNSSSMNIKIKAWFWYRWICIRLLVVWQRNLVSSRFTMCGRCNRSGRPKRAWRRQVSLPAYANDLWQQSSIFDESSGRFLHMSWESGTRIYHTVHKGLCELFVTLRVYISPFVWLSNDQIWGYTFCI